MATRNKHTPEQVVRKLATADREPAATSTAADVLFVLLGHDTFRAFTHGRGWPLKQCRAWVTTTLERDLFPYPASPAA
jgi:hypothetical protein